MSGTIELRLKGKAPPLPSLPPPPPTIQSMALAYQGKAQTIEVILRAAQSHPVNQHVNIYYSLTQAIINQEHNIVKAIKNAMVEIKKNNKLKGNLGNKDQENAFADIKKLSKITYKINKIKAVRNTIKKEQGKELLEGPYKLFYIYYALKSIRIFINQVKRSQISRKDALKIINNTILSRLELLKAGILRTLYPTPLDFLTAYKFGLVVNKELIKKQKLVYYPSQGHKLLVLALTIKTKEESAPEPVTLAPLLLPFKEVKALNAKMLRSLFLFGGKVPEV